jgi:curved DNA-binding protein
MKFVDYYKVLGVAKDASQEQINKAFRKLARQYHPDVNKEPGAENKFKEISEAYEVLKDPEKRKKYDMFGSNYKSGDQFRPPPGYENFSFRGGPGGGSFSAGGFSDFFTSMFGGAGGFGQTGGFDFQDMGDLFGQQRGGRRGPARGANVEAEVTVTLEDVHAGEQKTVTLQSPDGSERDTYTFTIPKGIESGKKIRLAGQGANGAAGPRGDLLIKLVIQQHPVFTRNGDDLECEIDVAPWEAALGAKVLVPTLDGLVEASLPAGTSSGRKLRLKKRGLAGKGDLYARIRIVVPAELSDEERKLFDRLAKVSDFKPRSR